MDDYRETNSLNRLKVLSDRPNRPAFHKSASILDHYLRSKNESQSDLLLWVPRQGYSHFE